MITVTVVIQDNENIIGAKEAVANALEPIGDILSVEVKTSENPKQINLKGKEVKL